MIERATTADFLNSVVNHPSVRPHVHAAPGPIDLTVLVGNPNNLALQGEHGGMVFVQHVPGLLEIHSQVLPEGRGPWMLQFAQAAVQYVFTRTHATEVFTRVPEGNVAAMALARACGAKPEHKPMVQNLPDGPVNLEIYGGRIQDWIKVAPGLPALGELFHSKLHEKAAAAGLKINHHEPDAWHDRHVGAAVAMILGGQPVKGVMFFNRWAAMALAPPVNVLSLDPLVLDITDCRIEVQDGDFQVIRCQ